MKKLWLNPVVLYSLTGLTFLFSIVGAPPVLTALSALTLGLLGASSAKKLKKQEALESEPVTVLNFKELTAIDDNFKQELSKLSELAANYARRKSPFSSTLNTFLMQLQLLCSKLQEQSDKQSIHLTMLKYTDYLQKLNEALGYKYYLDIEAHPELWSDPEGRMKAVEDALAATSNQLLRNLRQLNSSQALSYEVSVDSLVRLDAIEANDRAMGL